MALSIAGPTGLQLCRAGGLVHLRVELDGEESHPGTGTPCPGRLRSNRTRHHREGRKSIASAAIAGTRWARSLNTLFCRWASIHHAGSVLRWTGGGRRGKSDISNPRYNTELCLSQEVQHLVLPTEEFETVRLGDRGLPRARVRSRSVAPQEVPPALTWKLNNVFLPTMLNFA